jgi:hypothetical protein
MTVDEYLDLMRRSLQERYGTKLTFQCRADASRAARKFYRVREQARASGDTSFDILSLCRTVPGELRLYRRDRHTPPHDDDRLEAELQALTAAELPARPHRPRGPKKRRAITGLFLR